MKLEDIGWSVLRAFSDGIESANNAVKKHTGKSIFERMQEAEKKDAQLKSDNPTLWTAKHLAAGTLKGIIGSSLHKD